MERRRGNRLEKGRRKERKANSEKEDGKKGEEEEPRETIDCRALKPQFSTS